MPVMTTLAGTIVFTDIVGFTQMTDEHGDDLVEPVPVLLQPGEDAAGVEPSRVGDDGCAPHAAP